MEHYVGRKIKYTGNDAWLLARVYSRLGTIVDAYTDEVWDDDAEENYEALVAIVRFANSSEQWEIYEEDFIFLSPDDVINFEEQERREAHADKYL